MRMRDRALIIGIGLITLAIMCVAAASGVARPTSAAGVSRSSGDSAQKPLAAPAPGSPKLKIVAAETSAGISFLSWDTEGGVRIAANLLRPGSAIVVQFLDGGVWRDATLTSRRLESAGKVIVYVLSAGNARLEWRIETYAVAGTLKITLSTAASPSLRLVFPFDPTVTSTTVLPADWRDDGTFRLPAVINAPDFGPMLLAISGPAMTSTAHASVPTSAAVSTSPPSPRPSSASSSASAIVCRLEGSRANKIVDLIIDLPDIAPNHSAIAPARPSITAPRAATTPRHPAAAPSRLTSLTLTLTPLVLPPPAGLRATDLWLAARRGWLNALQPCARWGEQDKPFSSPPGILGNNVISDPASISLWFYADQAFFTPDIAPGISLMPLVRRSLDFWLDHRMRHAAASPSAPLTGEITGYWDYGNFLDAEASPLIAAWDYVESTRDLDWLARRIERLELVADFLARRDVDGDGFVEATQSGNRGTLVQPNRSDAWWDALNCGWKDGYTNALIYRAWRSLADLERKLGRAPQAAAYARLASRLKAVYAATLYNPRTNWLAWWKSRDGELHDYASPTLNGLAVEYGLVDPVQGRRILDRLWKKIGEAGFTRFDLGVPPMLIPVRRSDYLQPDAIGIPQREDGTDTFGWYMNGGITAGHVLHFLMAHYVLGDRDLATRADTVLRAMLERQRRGEFQNGVRDAGGQGIDWTDWQGKPTGYEGYLADSFRFLQAVLLREEAFRARLYRPLVEGGEEDTKESQRGAETKVIGAAAPASAVPAKAAAPISKPAQVVPPAAPPGEPAAMPTVAPAQAPVPTPAAQLTPPVPLVKQPAPAPPAAAVNAVDSGVRSDIAFLEDAARKLLAGCVMRAGDGTLLYTPDGKANYAALWTRDFAYMVENAGDLMPLPNIERCIEYLIKGIRESDGAVPDHVQVDGLPLYAAGGPDNQLGQPGLDNAPFLVFAASAYLDMIPAEKRSVQYAKWAPRLIKGMNYIPRGAASGLVWNDPAKPHSPYGFTDTVGKTGELLMESLLYWRACRMLARLEGLYGFGQDSRDFEARAVKIEKNIGVLWDDKTGMFFAATRDCRQTDVWASAYAVAIDFPLAEGMAPRILDWLVDNYYQYVWHGQVRHLPLGEYWERLLMPVEKDRYQNGAFWATPAGWVMEALNRRDPGLARRMFSDLIDDFRVGGICECVNVGYRKLESYVDSATNPLGAARRLWGK